MAEIVPAKRRAFAYIVVGMLPDDVNDELAQMYVKSGFSQNGMMLDVVKSALVVVGPGETPESLIAYFTRQPLPVGGTRPQLVTH